MATSTKLTPAMEQMLLQVKLRYSGRRPTPVVAGGEHHMKELATARALVKRGLVQLLPQGTGHGFIVAPIDVKKSTVNPTPKSKGSKLVNGVETHKQRDTGTSRSVGRVEDLGISNDGEPEFKYATVCNDHGTFILSETRALANKSFSVDFCDDCRAIIKAKDAEAKKVAAKAAKASK